jgi:hypothetical protein
MAVVAASGAPPAGGAGAGERNVLSVVVCSLQLTAPAARRGAAGAGQAIATPPAG